MVSMPVFADDNIKQPALAGTWYPASGVALSLSLDQYFKEADVSENKDVGVVIAPHAGYDFWHGSPHTDIKLQRTVR